MSESGNNPYCSTLSDDKTYDNKLIMSASASDYI